MGVSSEDINKAIHLTKDELYERIRSYYVEFIEYWMTLNSAQKSKYVFGNGRTCRAEIVDNSHDYIKALKSKPSKLIMKDVAMAVKQGSLEFAFHNHDDYGIKMGAYAELLCQ